MPFQGQKVKGKDNYALSLAKFRHTEEQLVTQSWKFVKVAAMYEVTRGKLKVTGQVHEVEIKSTNVVWQ